MYVSMDNPIIGIFIMGVSKIIIGILKYFSVGDSLWVKVGFNSWMMANRCTATQMLMVA